MFASIDHVGFVAERLDAQGPEADRHSAVATVVSDAVDEEMPHPVPLARILGLPNLVGVGQRLDQVTLVDSLALEREDLLAYSGYAMFDAPDLVLPVGQAIRCE